MGDTTVRVEQATNTQRIVSLESRMRKVDLKLDDKISKKAITWVLGTVGSIVAIASFALHMMGE